MRNGLNPFRRYSNGFRGTPGKHVSTAAVFLPGAQTFVDDIFRLRLHADTLQLMQALAPCFTDGWSGLYVIESGQEHQPTLHQSPDLTTLPSVRHLNCISEPVRHCNGRATLARELASEA